MLRSSAKAGTYVPVYSGGQLTYNNNGTKTTYPYQATSTGIGTTATIGWGTQTVNGQTSATSGSVSASGTITTAFVWQPNGANDPPPSQAVIAETSQVWYGTGNNPGAAATTTTCDNNLGWKASTPGYGNASGTRYKIQNNPGQGFTITSTPTVTLAGTGAVGPPAATGGGQISVNYQATAAPLDIVLTGGLGPNGSKSYLIGQQVGASVTNSSGLAASGYNWTASGNPFKNWQFAWKDSSSPTSTVLVPFGTQTQPSVTFCYSQASPGGSQSTVATSVHLAVPSGSLPTAGLDTNLSQTCTVVPPTWSIGTVTGATILIPNQGQSGVGFYGATYTYPSGTSPTAGIIWYGTVVTPTAYGSGGGWNVTQLVKPHRVRTENGTVQGIASNDTWVLDTTFGYDPVYPSLYPDTNTQTGSWDTPWNPVDSGTESLTINDSFHDYQLYRPPGTGSCFVPLQDFTWFWKGQVLPDQSGGWKLFNPGGSSTLGGSYPTHPIWSSNVTQGSNFVP